MNRKTIVPSSTGLSLQTHETKPPILQAPALADIASARSWLLEHRDAIQTELLRHSHLLIRGLPVRQPADFGELRNVLVTERAAYKEKATPRSDYGGDVYSSTDLPAVQPIQLHNENSYTLEFPRTLLFCCLEAPEQGGATTVGDVRQVLASLPDDLVTRFKQVGWLLTRNYHDHVGLPWSTAFSTGEREEVEEYCARNLIGCEWSDASGLRTVQRRSAVVRHPITQEEVWFNHAAFWSRWSLEEEVLDVLTMTYGDDGLPFDTSYGDGSALGEEEARILNSAYAKATRREDWQPGDIMLVDNVLSAHGRESYRGNRKILVAMGEPIGLDTCAPSVPPAAHPFS